MHWACTKITASLSIPDATLLEILLDKVIKLASEYASCLLLVSFKSNI